MATHHQPLLGNSAVASSYLENKEVASYGATRPVSTIDEEAAEGGITGLTSARAAALLEEHGRNEIEEEVTPLYMLFVKQFWGTMPLMIIVAMIVSAIVRLPSLHLFVGCCALPTFPLTLSPRTPVKRPETPSTPSSSPSCCCSTPSSASTRR